MIAIAAAYGIDISDIEGNFQNSGNIIVSLEVNDVAQVEAFGIEPNDILSGASFVNSGSMTVNTSTQECIRSFCIGNFCQ